MGSETDGAHINGGAGNDFLFGTAGNDTINGESGHDDLWGFQGFDALAGGSGDDVLISGSGPDQVFGDGGDDIFVLDPLDQGTGNSGFNTCYYLSDTTHNGVIGCNEAFFL